MNARFRIAGPLAAVAALALSAPTAASGQEGGPLLKSDLVRMMTASNYTATEMAAIVRMNCVGFEPTARDRNQLGNLPNADLILAEVDRCMTRPRPAAAEAESAEPEVVRAPPRPARGNIRLTGFDLASNVPVAPELRRPESQANSSANESTVETADEVETPPALLNWKEVSAALLREYRPNERRPGTVQLWLRIGPDGRVAESRVKHATGDPALADAARLITEVMEFRPATRRDRPVESWTELPIDFSSR